MIERSGEMSSKNQDLGHSVIKAFMNFKHAELKSFQIPGYSKSETRFIFILSRGLKSKGPKIRVSDLGHMLRISKPSVTQMMQSLEGKGLIKRVQNPEDKRSMYVELTDVGAAVSEKMLDEFQASFEDMQEFLGEDDMKKLITLLEKLTDYLNTKSENKEA